MKRFFLFSLTIIFVLFPDLANAQVVINEFSSPESSGDWVELYAIETTDISGWIIRDSAESVVETIPAGTMINAAGYYVIEAGNRLNKEEDIVKLLKSDDTTLVDSIPYGADGQVCEAESGQTIGRYPDSNSTIERFSTPSKNSSNSSATLAPCPAPTAKPDPTNTPTPTSTPTPTVKPTNTSTPTKKLTPTPTRAEEEDEDEDEESPILGISNEIPQLSDESEKKESEDEKKDDKKRGKIPLMAGVFVLAGVSFMTAACYPFLKQLRLKRKEKSLEKRND